MRNSVQRGGGGPLVLVCVYVNQHETGHQHVPILHSFPVKSDVHPIDAQKNVSGFGIYDIFSCVLEITRKLTFLECQVAGVTKCRINTMFRTNSKCNYCLHSCHQDWVTSKNRFRMTSQINHLQQSKACDQLCSYSKKNLAVVTAPLPNARQQV